MTRDKYYNLFKDDLKDQLYSNDKAILDNEGMLKYDFFTELARNSFYIKGDENLVSGEGHTIKMSYCSWHDIFIRSTDRTDEKFYSDLVGCTGACCTSRLNDGTNKVDYIVALNSDVYDHVSYDVTEVTLAHEIGHALLDHQSHPIEIEESGSRSIERELEADLAGFKWLEKRNGCKLTDDSLYTTEYFRFKHSIACAMFVFGEKGVDTLSRYFGLEYYEMCRLIGDRFLTKSKECCPEDAPRYEQYLKWIHS